MRRALAAAPLLLLAAAAPPVPFYRTFGHWFVACDNTRSCEAGGFNETDPVDLRIQRSAGPSPVFVVLGAAEGTKLDPAAIRLDGKPFPLAPPAWTASPSSPGNPAAVAAADTAVVADFIARTRAGTTLQLGPGDDAATVPLDGMSAALLLMDAAQNRPGTPTALVAPTGPATVPPAPPVPAPPRWRPPPKLTPAETRTLLNRAAHLPQPANETCDLKVSTDLFPLDADNALAIRPCQLYAYQSVSLVYVLSRRGTHAPVPVRLPLPGIPKPDGQSTGPDMTEPTFDPATGQLSTASKGRGIGDCGLFATWTWHANAFHLIDMSYMGQCGGSSPGDFPSLFRTAARTGKTPVSPAPAAP